MRAASPSGPRGRGKGSDEDIKRNTARVLPVDPAGRVLLLHGWDPERPEPFWFTSAAPRPGEPLPLAAVRELREEAGIVVDAARLGEPIEIAPIIFVWSASGSSRTRRSSPSPWRRPR